MNAEIRTGGPFSYGPNGERAVTTTCPKCSNEVGVILKPEVPRKWNCPHCKAEIGSWDGTSLAIFGNGKALTFVL